MKKLSLSLAGVAIALAAVPVAANAQPWRSIDSRQAQLDRRIDQGIRSGSLNRREAGRLRSDLRGLSALEARYYRSGGGLSMGERRDLQRRFDALSARVRVQKHDRQHRW